MKALWQKLLDALFPKVTTYQFSMQALAAMQAFAQETHPKEAFAILSGTRNGTVLVIERVVYQPFVNTTRSATVSIDRYALDNFVGTFHSHPTKNAQPSAADRALFAKHPGLHCILGWPYTVVHVYNQNGKLLGTEQVTARERAAQSR